MPFLSLFLGGLCIGVQGAFRQSFQLVFLKRKLEIVGFLEVVLREAQGEDAHFRRYLTETFLLLWGQVGSASDESVISVLEKHPVFVVQGLLVDAFIHLLDAGKQGLVQGDVVAMFG